MRHLPNEDRYLAGAVAALDDRIALRGRLDELEMILKTESNIEKRRAARREFLDLTEPRAA